ncbi:DUF5706 domain-containing protein [Sinomonas sp. ASV486]|uniref:Pycsar system effector family protein n=1 Tax=Sinomonas sp. ASV486 TaxID=3051170 RepID=UPI0027DB3962|nr:Pycsar system effector family protein [Sinomonas sp. ASV486]MDQ4489038.1 DUF5706 domain-containing protein [Sinomonas sp. ASV486]
MSIAFEVAAVACATAIFLAGVCAMIGLYPIVSLSRPPDFPEATTNPLFFHDVARQEQEIYWPTLQALTADPDGLVRHIGQQIHANSSVALRKYRWADRSIRALLVDLLALASVATIAAFGW